MTGCFAVALGGGVVLAEPLAGDDGVLVAEAEQVLASHPDFGVTDLIWRRASARLRFALEVLGERLPGVAEVLPGLAAEGSLPHVVRDPVVRMATEAALQRLRTGQLRPPDALEQVLRHAAAFAQPDADRACAQSGVPAQREEGCGLRAGPGGRIWVLGFPDSPGLLPGLLAKACADNFIEQSGRTGELNPGTARTVELVNQACEVLAALLPVLGLEAIGHVTGLGMVTADGDEGAMLSAAGGAPVPGIIVIRPGELERPWDAAGRILHEALHLKLFDISVCSALIADLDTVVEVPWRPVRWEIRRVLAACHVYAHMAVFHAAVRARGHRFAGRFGEPPANPGVSSSGSDSYAHAQDRLRYLAGQLTGPLAGHLTPAGRRFVGWQLSAVAPLIGWQPEAQLAGRPPAPRSHPPAGYRRVNGVVARPDQQAGALLVFNSERGVLHVVNLAVWVAFQLCDGRNLAALRHSYAEVVASKLTAPQAARHLDAALAQLREAGLIEPATESVSSEGRR